MDPLESNHREARDEIDNGASVNRNVVREALIFSNSQGELLSDLNTVEEINTTNQNAESLSRLTPVHPQTQSSLAAQAVTSQQQQQQQNCSLIRLTPDSYGRDCKCACSCHSLCDNMQKEDHELTHETEWVWDGLTKSSNADLLRGGREVLFHKHFSNGTAAVKGTQPMTSGQHYWEVKMTTSVYGTDMMVGFGTSDVDLNAYSTTFVSLLGRDSESWGLSYSGEVLHNGSRRHMCKRFGEGAVIGIHLDMWLGKVSFFKNGKCLGVAFSGGIRGKALYPMVCSTAARTGMRIVRSCSFPMSLEFLCCQALRKCVRSDLKVTKALALAPGLSALLENNFDWLLRPHPPENYASTVCALKKRPIKCIQEEALGKQYSNSKKKRIDEDD